MKTCARCKQSKPLTEFWKNKLNKDGFQTYCKDCCRKNNREDYERHCEERKAYARADCRKVKQEVLTAYGGCCQCCGEDRLVFLAIDHKDGGGTQHRKKVGAGVHFYRWLRRQGYPDGYRVLCHNCNWATAWGTCPHQEK